MYMYLNSRDLLLFDLVAQLVRMLEDLIQRS